MEGALQDEVSPLAPVYPQRHKCHVETLCNWELMARGGLTQPESMALNIGVMSRLQRDESYWWEKWQTADEVSHSTSTLFFGSVSRRRDDRPRQTWRTKDVNL